MVVSDKELQELVPLWMLPKKEPFKEVGVPLYLEVGYAPKTQVGQKSGAVDFEVRYEL